MTQRKAKKEEDARDVFEKALDDDRSARDRFDEKRKYEMQRRFPKETDAGDRVKSNIAGAALGIIPGVLLGGKIGRALSRRSQIRKTGGWSSGTAGYDRATAAGALGGGAAGFVGVSEGAYANSKYVREKRRQRFEGKSRKE
jgi:uncharacterized protein YcfJ